MDKILWKNEWRFYEDVDKNYFGQVLRRRWIVELKDEDKPIKVILAETGYILKHLQIFMDLLKNVFLKTLM